MNTIYAIGIALVLIFVAFEAGYKISEEDQKIRYSQKVQQLEELYVQLEKKRYSEAQIRQH